MKKLLMAIALVVFPVIGLTGCGGSGGGPVEATSESDGMSAEQQARYEEEMKSGGGTSSSRPGN